jgi:2-polyprenyl-6-methoxyphenol hydroxylase-like FAD-dependent oxidoreductase
MDQFERVVVVGAGIGGLTAALLLAGLSDELILLERRAEPAEVGAGIMLQPNGLAVLDGLGLAATVRNLGRPQCVAELRNERAALLCRASTPEFGAGLDHFVAVLRSALHQTLLDAVLATPGITTRFGAPVTAAAPDGRVWVGSEPIPGDLVVGADGVGSIVRSSGRFGGQVLDEPTTYVRTLVSGEREALFAEYWTRLGAFGAAPVATDLVYCYAAAYVEPAAAALRRRDLGSFARIWGETLPLAGQLLARVETIDDLLINGVRRVQCRHWVDDRSVLIGDAAHAMAPNLGQGANSALVDAAVLADELSRQTSIGEALRAYERRRRRRVTRLQSIASILASLSGIRGRRLPAARDTLLRAVSTPRALERQIRTAQQEDPDRLRRTVTVLSRH